MLVTERVDEEGARDVIHGDAADDRIYGQNGDDELHGDDGDDAICLNSGKHAQGRARARPTENLVVRDCVVYHGHGGFVVGSEMSGGVRRVFAAQWIESARSGWWYQDGGGAWKQK